MRRILLALAILGGAVLGTTAPALAAQPTPVSGSIVAPLADAGRPADVNDFTFSSFHADYELTRAEDGTSRLRVVETIVAQFPDFDQNRGLMRGVPRYYQGVDTEPQYVSVTDENGNARPMEITDDGDFITMVSRADDYLHGAQTFVITYDVRNVARHFEDVDADEFYWDITGDEAEQPYDEVTATLHLDPELAAAANGNAACYWGSYGEENTCDITRTDDQTFEAVQTNIQPREGVSISVGFASGTFTMVEPTEPGFAPMDPLANGFLPLQLGLVGVTGAAVVGAGLYRRTALKDAPGYPTVIPQYEPPAGMDALAAAVMLGKRNRGLPAEVLEQGVRGTIQLIEGKHATTLTARLVDPSKAGDRDGQELIWAMFPAGLTPGAEYVFGQYDSHFAGQVNRILNGVLRAQQTGGVWRKVRGWIPGLIVTLCIIASIAAFFLGPIVAGLSGNPVWLGAGVVAIILSVIAGSMMRKKPYSELGAQLRDHLKGLEMFMQWAEADRIRMLQSPEGAERVRIDVNDPRQVLKLYEPLLPFAVVFGIEKEWSKLITVYYEQVQQMPRWYISPYGFTGINLASSLGPVTSSTTAPSSSSSSSFGGSMGGGFSGGGGGGGRIGGV